jgi:hypothetical protein
VLSVDLNFEQKFADATYLGSSMGSDLNRVRSHKAIFDVCTLFVQKAYCSPSFSLAL